MNGRYAEAKKEFQSALSALPDYQNAITNLNKLKALGQ
jgi:hypothetical protein